VDRTSTAQTLRQAFLSWRTAAVTLQSFPSSLPLGLVLIAVPAWLAVEGIDIKTIGFVTLAQVPWTFKFVWSPLMDRYAPPFLGRKRGWAVLAQAALLVATLALAFLADEPERVWLIGFVTLLIAFASASQDIAIDAYAVEVLHEDEQGVAAGARSALGRLALFLSGRVVITAAKWISWASLFALQGLIYLPAMVLMYFSPEPADLPRPPMTLRSAAWDPFVSFLRQKRAVEIAIFLTLYKFGDNLASSLVSPFLIQTGFDLTDVGIAAGTIGLVATVLGSITGGTITTAIGLGHALWLFGFLQAFSNIGYVLIAQAGPNRPLMYVAMAIEAATSGMGTGAFSVLLLRLTRKEFSATQYALLSSIFALGRTVAGPMAGLLVDAMGWSSFFILTIFAAAPGLVMLQRFVPLGVREPKLYVEAGQAGDPLSPASLVFRAAVGTVTGTAVAGLASASLDAVRALHQTPSVGFDLITPLATLLQPGTPGEWITAGTVLLFGIVCGLVSAALAAARRGIRPSN
jgi:MFS transporter, PAT family, beta-lactamase induction signal transducer AmpG